MAKREVNEWRCILLRGLIVGDLEAVQKEVKQNLESLTCKFTNYVEHWKLEWESTHWWQLADAGTVFIASMYSHPDVVQWLLDQGADRHLKCFLNQTALEIVGECSDNPKDIEECKKILKESPKVPDPPANFRFQYHVSTNELIREVVVSEEGEEAQEKVSKCSVDVRWDMPFSRGAIIKSYEVRYRLQPLFTQKPSGWKTEHICHSQERFEQGLTITELLPGAKYQLSARSSNVCGAGNWNEGVVIETPKENYTLVS